MKMMLLLMMMFAQDGTPTIVDGRLVCLPYGAICAAPAAAPPPSRSGLKVIRERCLSCHSGEKPAAGLKVDSVDNMVRGGKSGPAVVPGKPERSLIFMVLVGKTPHTKRVNRAEFDAIREWIAAGAQQYSMGGNEP